MIDVYIFVREKNEASTKPTSILQVETYAEIDEIKRNLLEQNKIVSIIAEDTLAAKS